LPYLRLPESIACLVVVVLVGCAPPPLTDSADGGRPVADAAGPSQEVEFQRVADLLRDNCANAGCHAAEGNAGFGIEGGASASDAQVRAALEGTTIPGERTKFVEPGQPAESVVFQALTGMEGRTPMPPGVDFAPTKIETIRRWIAQGALYE
jgi:hypothetical protein